MLGVKIREEVLVWGEKLTVLTAAKSFSVYA
jgi:hypothetical protein